jgi:murein L,D-transpeptidase YcbB/YkuD
MKKTVTTFVLHSLLPVRRSRDFASPKGTFLFTLATLGVIFAVSAAFTSRRVTREEITQRLRQSVENQAAAVYFTDPIQRVHLSAAFHDAYSIHNYQPLWVEDGLYTPQVNALLQALKQADQEGLSPATYHLPELELMLAEMALHPDAEKVAELDRLATASYLLYASHLFNGSISPVALDSNWHLLAKFLPLAHHLMDALQQASVFQSLANLLPAAESGYPRLKLELQRLKSIALQGGWPALSTTRVLQKNDTGQVVRELKQILYLMGYLDSTQTNPSLFDTDLQVSLRKFQQRHGLPQTAKVDKVSLRALNVPVEERIRQVTLNLERMRWLPRQLGDRFISVNIPEYKLRVVNNHQAVLEANVVVGKKGHETPIFVDTLESIVFSPEWNVPSQIATKEILPLVQRNPYYLQKNNFEVYDSWNANAKPINPYSVNWQRVTPHTFTYRIVQKSNEKNSLGAVKFLFPNPLNIYIHDTPAKQLFLESRRAFSHGCVRIENPEKLAACLLKHTNDWSAEKILSQLHQPEPVKVSLTQPVKVEITYLTAFIQNGVLQFRDDVYGYDQKQLAALLP